MGRFASVFLAETTMAALLMLLVVGSTSAWAREGGRPGGPPGQTACPAGGDKIDRPGPAVYRCGEDEVVTGICVKAGVPGYGVGAGETRNGAGCYRFSALGTRLGEVSGGGSGPHCKDISYSVFYCGPGKRLPICGNEKVEEGEQCDPPGRIDDWLVCNDHCKLVEVPKPEPPPVCGNEKVEPGETCDPPGRIDDSLVCDERCQLVEVPKPEPEPVCGNEKVEPGEACDPPGRIDGYSVCDEACQIVKDRVKKRRRRLK